MTDTELLDFAAKAAGIEYLVDAGRIVERFEDGHAEWNPLTDDGDALRLAVKLNMNLTYDTSPDGAFVFASCSWSDGEESNEVDLDNDPYAATRRVIVRTAAQIGRELE